MSFNVYKKSMDKISEFFDDRKVGSVGPLGFRRSSDLKRLLAAIEELYKNKILGQPGFNFLDMGCGDGRVNILMSYLANKSIGIELDEWTLDDYHLLREDLDAELKELQLPLPPDNIHLFEGDALDPGLHNLIFRNTKVAIEDIDIFYTYLTLHEEISELITREAKPGALFMVYGLERIMPRYEKLDLLTSGEPLQGIIAIYRKL